MAVIPWTRTKIKRTEDINVNQRVNRITINMYKLLISHSYVMIMYIVITSLLMIFILLNRRESEPVYKTFKYISDFIEWI
jgi:hypothetical protein